MGKKAIIILFATTLIIVTTASIAAAEQPNDHVFVLDDSNYEDLTKKGEWLVDYYAPWVGI